MSPPTSSSLPSEIQRAQTDKEMQKREVRERDVTSPSSLVLQEEERSPTSSSDMPSPASPATATSSTSASTSSSSSSFSKVNAFSHLMSCPKQTERSGTQAPTASKASLLSREGIQSENAERRQERIQEREAKKNVFGMMNKDKEREPPAPESTLQLASLLPNLIQYFLTGHMKEQEFVENIRRSVTRDQLPYCYRLLDILSRTFCDLGVERSCSPSHPSVSHALAGPWAQQQGQTSHSLAHSLLPGYSQQSEMRAYAGHRAHTIDDVASVSSSLSSLPSPSISSFTTADRSFLSYPHSQRDRIAEVSNDLPSSLGQGGGWGNQARQYNVNNEHRSMISGPETSPVPRFQLEPYQSPSSAANYSTSDSFKSRPSYPSLTREHETSAFYPPTTPHPSLLPSSSSASSSFSSPPSSTSYVPSSMVSLLNPSSSSSPPSLSRYPSASISYYARPTGCHSLFAPPAQMVDAAVSLSHTLGNGPFSDGYHPPYGVTEGDSRYYTQSQILQEERDNYAYFTHQKRHKLEGEIERDAGHRDRSANMRNVFPRSEVEERAGNHFRRKRGEEEEEDDYISDYIDEEVDDLYQEGEEQDDDDDDGLFIEEREITSGGKRKKRERGRWDGSMGGGNVREKKKYYKKPPTGLGGQVRQEWTEKEDMLFLEGLERSGANYDELCRLLPERTKEQIQTHWYYLVHTVRKSFKGDRRRVRVRGRPRSDAPSPESQKADNEYYDRLKKVIREILERQGKTLELRNQSGS